MPNYRDAQVTLIIEPAGGEPFAWFGGDASVYASSGEFDAKVVWLGQQEHVALSPAQLGSVRAALAAAPAVPDVMADALRVIAGERCSTYWSRPGDGWTGWDCRTDPGRVRAGVDQAGSWCDACVAKDALDRSVSPTDEHTETVTEYRVMAGEHRIGTSGDLATARYIAEAPQFADRSDVRVESRTVTTSRRESEWKATDQ